MEIADKTFRRAINAENFHVSYILKLGEKSYTSNIIFHHMRKTNIRVSFTPQNYTHNKLQVKKMFSPNKNLQQTQVHWNTIHQN